MNAKDPCVREHRAMNPGVRNALSRPYSLAALDLRTQPDFYVGPVVDRDVFPFESLGRFVAPEKQGIVTQDVLECLFRSLEALRKS